MILEQSERQLGIAAGLELEVRQPRRLRVDHDDLVDFSQDRRDLGVHGLDAPIDGQPDPGKPSLRIALDQMAWRNVERPRPRSLLHGRQDIRKLTRIPVHARASSLHGAVTYPQIDGPE